MKNIKSILYTSEITKYVFLLVIAMSLILPLAWQKIIEQREFREGILVESFGMLLDIIFLGIVLTFFQKIQQKRIEIKRNLEDIEDFRYWDEREGTLKISGIIRRLNNLGITKIDLHDCFLFRSKLQYINLKDSNLASAHLYLSELMNSNLENANLNEAILTVANLENSNLKNAIIKRAQLTEAKLKGADLFGASLEQANLTMADLSSTNLTEVCFDGTVLVDANLLDAKIDISGLSMALSLYGAKLNEDIKILLLDSNPTLFEKPDWYDNNDNQRNMNRINPRPY